jgi:hypothetical protein
VGANTGTGGGTLRDVLVRRIPVVLQSGSNAIPAFIGAGITVAAILGGAHAVVAAVSAATVCFLVRMLGVVLRPRRSFATAGIAVVGPIPFGARARRRQAGRPRLRRGAGFPFGGKTRCVPSSIVRMVGPQPGRYARFWWTHTPQHFQERSA